MVSRKLCFFFDEQILSPFINLGQSIGLVLLLFRDMGCVGFHLQRRPRGRVGGGHNGEMERLLANSVLLRSDPVG